MPSQPKQARREFSLRWLLWAYAILATLPLLSALQGFDREQDQLIVVSDLPILAMTVTQAGREAQPWPRTSFPRDQPQSLLFPDLRRSEHGGAELAVRWRTARGERVLTSSMAPADLHRECLFLLRLDGEGAPVGSSAGGGIERRCVAE